MLASMMQNGQHTGDSPQVHLQRESEKSYISEAGVKPQEIDLDRDFFGSARNSTSRGQSQVSNEESQRTRRVRLTEDDSEYIAAQQADFDED